MADDRQRSRDDGPDIADILTDLLSGGKSDPLRKVERLMRITSDVLLSDREETKAAGTFKEGGFSETLALIISMALDRPETLAAHLSEFAGIAMDILMQDADNPPEPGAGDRRFRDPLWRESPVLRGLMQLYLAWGDSLQSWIDSQNLSQSEKLRVDFVLRQLLAAFSPSNLPIHPAAIKRAEKSHGMSAVAALKNLFRDVQHNRGMPRQVNPGYFEVGRNLAVTPGAVVFRNDVLELIQYAPQTTDVHHCPICLIPPQINKYYAFDLKPANSLLGYLVAQGLQVYTISWKNPGRISADWGIEHYLDAILDASNAIRDISRCDEVSLISACAGGFTAMSLMGHLAQIGQPFVRSNSLLVTALFPGTGGLLEEFVTSENLEMARRISQAEGTMNGQDLAHLFAWLRPEDLVWTFWVNNNILGRQPPPLDVLYWDNDPTRVPARLHTDFIDIYLNDVFRIPGAQSLFGSPIDYDKLRVPTYFVGGQEDYLMPWQGVYQVAQRFAGDHRFVLSTSGHVQSILRPPNLANSRYFTNPDMPADTEVWMRDAQPRDGTWWADWADWLKARSGPTRRAPNSLGTAQYPALYGAPGTYVREPMPAR